MDSGSMFGYKSPLCYRRTSVDYNVSYITMTTGCLSSWVGAELTKVKFFCVLLSFIHVSHVEMEEKTLRALHEASIILSFAAERLLHPWSRSS